MIVRKPKKYTKKGNQSHFIILIPQIQYYLQLSIKKKKKLTTLN